MHGVGKDDVEALQAKRAEIIEENLGRIGWVADGERAEGDTARLQQPNGALHSCVSRGALKCPAMDVVDLCRAIDADGQADLVPLEAVDPGIVDENAIGGERERDDATGALGDGAAFHAQ